MTQAYAETSEMNVGNESQGGSDDLYVFPASSAQQRLWFLHQLEPQSAAYNISKAIRLAGEFNVQVFVRALNEIIRRHEILRTTFAMLGGQPVQLVSEYQPVTLPLIDLSALEPTERVRLSKQLAAEEAHRPFNLRRGPLLRTTLLRLAPDDHVALFTMHHIVSDAWSVGVFVKEFTALYSAFKAGEQSPLPELPIQYGDYAEWQRDSLQGEVLEKQLSYWEEHLAAVPAVIELPIDHARPSMPSGNGAKLPFDLGPELLSSLKELSQRKNATLFMTVLAAWQVLLYRYSGQDQVCVGTPVAGRTRAETENLIGFFINTLVLRTDLSGNPTFIELLQRVRAVCLGAYAHQDIPFERIVDHLQPERSLSHTPFFQVMFALQNTRSEVLELPGLKLLPFDNEIRTSKFDLTLSLGEGSDTLAGGIEYNTDLFEEETISRMLGHFRQLLKTITADPQQRIGDVSLLTESERQQLLRDFNDTAAEFPQDLCLHQLIEQQVGRTPEQVAVVFEEEEVSYRELNERANQLAHHLRSLGVGPESPVGILMERSVEMVMALLGVLKAGGAYVPLDPEYPVERLRFMLEDAQVSVLITQQRLAALLPPSISPSLASAPLLMLEEAAEQLRQYETSNPELLEGAENLAYIIYTSGSTGQPKGAMNTQRGIINRLLWMQAAYGLNEQDRVLQKTPFSFDVSVWEFFWPLLTGARLVLARPGGHRDGQYLRELIIKERITTLHFVPSMLRVFLEEEGLEECR
ncbi:MAG TPA: condensation domain-containing protein, partial [Pyrinomonadaceae bacterium]|nr:condensation domain-containing protein [Pyrinomonadaceae bacterium]